MAIRVEIPRDEGLDHSLALLNEGYLFIQNRARRLQTDIFQSRLLAQNVICMTGPEAAKLFYNEELFVRKGAAPKRVQKTLFGQNGVQGLDGAVHKQRKHMFMKLMSPERLKVIVDLTKKQWMETSKKWVQKDQVVLFDEVQEMLCKIACEWAGVPISESEAKNRANDLGEMVDAFGAIGPRHWRGRGARARSEQWVGEIIEHIRNGELDPPKDTAAYAMAWHRELNGKRLETQIAAVELLNILRPIVAIATYIIFGAHALHEHPECMGKLQSGSGQYVQRFVQEVRRFYPFTPFVGARVRRDFAWKQYPFKSETLVLLDVYGINHDPHLWDRPDEFRPDRFNNWEGGLFDLIPQGGGDRDNGHRCAGEWLTINVMEASLNFLTNQINYDVPVQDLSISLSRIPTLPADRFIISNVRQRES
ncbi:cytochrome P450 [Sporolactobacillus shoreae]|uniref:Cytochrome P450 n=1 Tax=Sporolactobacillus shoreae TaxID=1465501 RepID=A0A4Z0GHD7_9BACL|nr:cytochrome P450 [Sporolactobacillus shoreae]TGA96117.1 cytochrome P450 [Sporolactobacillus shoreae]